MRKEVCLFLGSSDLNLLEWITCFEVKLETSSKKWHMLFKVKNIAVVIVLSWTAFTFTIVIKGTGKEVKQVYTVSNSRRFSCLSACRIRNRPETIQETSRKEEEHAERERCREVVVTTRKVQTMIEKQVLPVPSSPFADICLMTSRTPLSWVCHAIVLRLTRDRWRKTRLQKDNIQTEVTSDQIKTSFSADQWFPDSIQERASLESVMHFRDFFEQHLIHQLSFIRWIKTFYLFICVEVCLFVTVLVLKNNRYKDMTIQQYPLIEHDSPCYVKDNKWENGKKGLKNERKEEWKNPYLELHVQTGKSNNNN